MSIHSTLQVSTAMGRAYPVLQDSLATIVAEYERCSQVDVMRDPTRRRKLQMHAKALFKDVHDAMFEALTKPPGGYHRPFVPEPAPPAEPPVDPGAKAHCAICCQPMPEGEEMFRFHGYSGPCPAPPAEPPADPSCGTAELSDPVWDPRNQDWD